MLCDGGWCPQFAGALLHAVPKTKHRSGEDDFLGGFVTRTLIPISDGAVKPDAVSIVVGHFRSFYFGDHDGEDEIC
jgi:hypothetical protein